MGIHAPEVIVILNDDEEGTSAFGIVENSDRNVRRRQVRICSMSDDETRAEGDTTGSY